MSNLDETLRAIQADTLFSGPQHEELWQTFCQQNQGLFERVKQSKPDVEPISHLLGILTKAHIDAQTSLEQHLSSLQAMQQALEENLGEANAGRFNNHSLTTLVFITHLWLYLQGYLKMDFSLANDHAEQAASLISKVNKHDVQILRTEFMQSFYLGDHNSPIVEKTNPILRWFKSLFS
ncbi:hypothetical protein [Vibrio sinaloensis]|uniref:hypothetical protein n=1 Tax=Photobacterium sp. (strain ATCC 43367) TaxID=379097 RepID=UPI0035ECCB7F